MPALLLIGVPIAVVVLFWGIMTLPDDSPLKDSFDDSDKDKKDKKKNK